MAEIYCAISDDGTGIYHCEPAVSRYIGGIQVDVRQDSVLTIFQK